MTLMTWNLHSRFTHCTLWRIYLYLYLLNGCAT